MATALIHQAAAYAMSRSTMWRMLDDADRKPHRRVSWLTSQDPAFEAQAQDLCHLSVNAVRFLQHGRLVMCTDAKTGRHIVQRKHPT